MVDGRQCILLVRTYVIFLLDHCPLFSLLWIRTFWWVMLFLWRMKSSYSLIWCEPCKIKLSSDPTETKYLYYFFNLIWYIIIFHYLTVIPVFTVTFSALFSVIGVVLPTPVGRCRYWHRSLNPKKLVEVFILLYLLLHLPYLFLYKFFTPPSNIYPTLLFFISDDWFKYEIM